MLAGMTGFCAIQGIPIIQYVNARARTDDWPPKYCKVSSQVEALLLLVHLLARMKVQCLHFRVYWL